MQFHVYSEITYQGEQQLVKTYVHPVLQPFEALCLHFCLHPYWPEHSADDNCILGKLEFVGDRIVEENQEFCMEGEYVLDELAESFMVGNHKF